MSKLRSHRRLVPIVILSLILAYALIVPALDPQAVHRVDLNAVYQPPSAQHWFGTDQLGRDVFVRAAQALRLSLLLALCATFFSTVLGVIGGMLAAAFGGIIDRIIMRSVDALNAIPHLLLGVVVLALWPGMAWAIVLSIALTHWTQVARIIRARLVQERERGYVSLARASGAPAAAIWCTHLVPAAIPQAGIALVLMLPHAIWHESALSFLGVGLPPQSASLGLILEDARAGILLGAWWLLFFPALLLVLVSWSVAVFAHAQPRTAPTMARRSTRSTPRQGQREGQGEGRQVDTAAIAATPEGGVTPALEARDLTVWAQDAAGGRVHLLSKVSFGALPGTITMIMGKSGAGKSLLLKSLAGLLPHDLHSGGELRVNGHSVTQLQIAKLRGSSLVFIPSSAATALNPVRTVGSMLRSELRRNHQPHRHEALVQIMQQVDLQPQLLKSYPHELSGGQAQRVLLSLALISRAETVLLDEPTSALDRATRDVVIGVLSRLAHQGSSIVMTTHDPQLAGAFGARVVRIEGGHLMEKMASEVGA
ncbi:ATP-binding cassette domain-containing protein [Glutamicibacter sp.]|uniref:ATP-binding cassette domain-containing protein n=1 Tax=Glutamicibacter sp. TaxID=1931995 RepID=UPI0028BE21C1|nr:ATP-binding cassette domain-containing protein [Glutamicibacter sp.]